MHNPYNYTLMYNNTKMYKGGVALYQNLRKYLQGDTEALTKIIENFTPLIFRESSKYVIKDYDFEDLVQHGYLSVIKACNKFCGEEKAFIPYCIKTIKTNYKALLKGEIKHHREVPDENIADSGISNYNFTLEDEILAYENIKGLYKALDKLSDKERYIINSFYIQDKKLKEIALDLNKSYNNIRYSKEKILKKLYELLKT